MVARVALDVDAVGVVAVVRGQGPQPVGREELVLVEQPGRAGGAGGRSPTTPSSRWRSLPGSPAAAPALQADQVAQRRCPRVESGRSACPPSGPGRARPRRSPTAASSGMMPTIERTLTGTVGAVGRRPAGRSRSRPPRPTRPGSSMAVRMAAKCSRNLSTRSVGRPVPDRFRIEAMVPMASA